MVLGATRGGLLRGVMFAGMPVPMGTVVGLVASALPARSLATVLVGVTRLDPLTDLTAAGIMMSGATLGGLLAASRIHSLFAHGGVTTGVAGARHRSR